MKNLKLSDLEERLLVGIASTTMLSVSIPNHATDTTRAAEKLSRHGLLKKHQNLPFTPGSCCSLTEKGVETAKSFSVENS